MEGWRKICNPVDAAIRYSEMGVDELIFIDVVASLYQRNSLLDIIRDVSSSVFIPLTVGGGIRNVEDVRLLLANGADKITLNTGAIKDPMLINRISDEFGSQATIVAIEAVNNISQEWEPMTDNGRNKTGKEVVAWAQEAEERGAGEILLTSIDHDGVGNGYNIELVKKVSEAVNIPVIASGGFGKLFHLKDLIELTEASAATISQALHFEVITIQSLNNVVDDCGCSNRNVDNMPK